MGSNPKNITFRYVYPEDLRDFYVNGAFGGVTPRKEIYVHFYSERHPIPKTVTHKIKEDGTLGEPQSKETGGDVVRLIQASIVMDLKTAVGIRDWLNDRIALIDQADKEKPNGKKGRN